MRKLAIFVLLVSVLLACEAPAYAKHHHGNKHVNNKEARQTQKRNKARAKQLRKEARTRQKSRNNTPYQ